MAPCPDNGWQYIDPAGNIQGPFPIEKMRIWHRHNFFYADLPMRSDPVDAFLPFGQLFPAGEQPFHGRVLRCRQNAKNGLPMPLRQVQVSEVMSGKFAKAAEDAKRYATQHDLERTVTQMVNSLMATKPEDPDAHMLRYLLTTCSPDQLREAPVKITRERDPNTVFVADPSVGVPGA
eukprot:g10055.t1